MDSNNNDDKINASELINPYLVPNDESFSNYIKAIYEDLCLRTDDKLKGISKLTFLKYFNLPGIISERLFSVFDNNQDNYISVTEFTSGMTTLYTGTYDQLVNLIFELYDFDKDGKLCREDIRIVLSYIPLQVMEESIKKNRNKGQILNIGELKDRIDSQVELFHILKDCFKDEKEQINKQKFNNLIENVTSEIFVYIIIFLLQKKPFTHSTLKEFGTSSANSSSKKLTEIRRLSSEIDKKPEHFDKIARRKNEDRDNPNRLSLNFQQKSNNKFGNDIKLKSPTNSPRNTMIKSPRQTSKFALGGNILLSPNDSVKSKSSKDFINLSEANSNLRSNKKHTTDFKDPSSTQALKHKDSGSKTLSGIKKLDLSLELDPDMFFEPNSVTGLIHSGFLFIWIQGKLKKKFFKLIGKEIYYYNNKDDLEYKEMHHLSGVFVQQEKEEEVEGKKMYCFSLVFHARKKIMYLSNNENDIKTWISAFHYTIGYMDITEIYDIGEKIGNGKFGVVKIGINKITKDNVAIKILSKKDMNYKEFELVRAEIEILKVCQHPNIIRIYDVFENLDYIYIIMEYCGGSDLNIYLQKKGYKISEMRAADIIERLATAVFYLHSYGIAHRDIKPENILMTDYSDLADIKLSDFGLSIMIGPGETCVDSIGTINYISPEVFLKKPYDKSVDIWAIGIITYLLLTSTLPFDSKNGQNEIIKKIINDPVPFDKKILSTISPEAKTLLDNLLQKDPQKRYTIKEVIENKWFALMNNKKSRVYI